MRNIQTETISTKKKAAAGQNIKEKNYWLKNLSGDFIKTSFYYDFPRKETSENPGKTLEFQFSSQLFTKLMQLSNRSDPRLHMILTAGLLVLLAKYSGHHDITLGIPAYKQEAKKELINTVLALRNPLQQSMTFKELLIQVRQTITQAAEHANYPIELLPEQLNMENPPEGDFPLFDITILLENIHDKEYISHIRHNMTFSFMKKAKHLQGTVTYNSLLYRRETIQQIVNHYTHIFQQVLSNVDQRLSAVEVLSQADKQQLLLEFSSGESHHTGAKTLHELFEEQVRRTPEKIAVSSPTELNDLFSPTGCFKKNPYLCQSPLEYTYEPGKDRENAKKKQAKVKFKFLKTPGHNSVIINDNMSTLLDLFNGEENIQSIYSRLEKLKNIIFIVYFPETLDILEITHAFANSTPQIFSAMSWQDFVTLVRLLYRNHLLEAVGFKSHHNGGEVKKLEPEAFTRGISYPDSIPVEELLNIDKELSRLSRADVLLMGDSPGMPSTGLLYLAAFLKRNNIKAYCRFYDSAADYPSMKKDIEILLEKIQPKIVAISLKWFLYIARVLDMCRIVKEYSQQAGIPIKVVVGGNTASYYSHQLIIDESVDYIILGDGELPLLKICQEQDETKIPNCVFKNKNTGEIIQTPITYIKNQSNSPDIYLSHLDEIMLFGNTVPFGTFFIYTHLGCRMKCVYCGGCHHAQLRSFNRERVFFRPVREARKDITEAMPYVSTFQFDFDIPISKKDLLEYCRQMWAGIDLSGHYCIISRVWNFNSPQLIKLAVKTFKYVYWDIDVAALSERHRQQLKELGLVKPQPTNQEILTFLQYCDPYENTEVRFNLIAGLPCLIPEDMETSEKFLSSLLLGHPSFSELHWARLHAQPGAPIIEEAETYNMHSFASTYEDFLEYSKNNFNSQSPHQRLEHLNYPYVYFNDDPLNSKITLNYSETNQKIQQYKEQRRINRLPGETLTYNRLDKHTNQLARLLRSKGVSSDTIVAVMLPPSPAIVTAILAVLKAGGGYMPVEPGNPPERIKYMLEDSQTTHVITQQALKQQITTNPSHQPEIHFIDIDDNSIYEEADTPPININHPTDMLYTIYTSGTTGKPKGVMLTHKNLVNYINWFMHIAKLNGQDKSVLTSSFAFDLGYTSLYPPLLKGGQSHVVPRDIYMSPDRLLDYIDRNEITYLKLTPSLLKPLVNSTYFSSKKCQSLRLILVGGEPINLEDIHEVHTLYPHLEIINHYGPTEATIGCAARHVDFQRFEEYKITPTIGRPIENTAVYILDKHLNLLPIGVPGELCISGACIARGYLNRPGLTADRFYRSYTSYITYQTGDLARWLADGNIQFLGRIDHQVKIRGFRVELEEIKNQLLKHRQIKDTFVTVIDIERGDTETDKKVEKHLCAYIVPQGADTPPVEAEPTGEQEVPPKKILKIKDIDLDLNEELKQKADRMSHLVNQNYDDRFMLSVEEKTRYTRQMLLDQWGIESQEKLKSSTVFVAGAGGGASPTITQLALAGIGTIIVCDCDVVELSNLNRQFLHDETRLGMNKAISAQMTVQRLNPHVKVIPITEKLTDQNVFELVGDAEIIFDMFDDLESKFILSRCAVAKQIPHVISAMTELSSYAAVFHTPYTPCYHCLFDSEKYQNLTRELRTLDNNYSKKPLHVAASSLFVSTGFAVTEAIKILLDFENPAYNKYFLFNQKGTKNIANTDGYRMMTFAYSEHFRKISLRQGFDWEKGWNEQFVVELEIEPDPDCPLCSPKNRAQLETLKGRAAKANKHRENQSPETGSPNASPQTVLLLPDNEIQRTSTLIGVLKAGKIAVLANADTPGDFEPQLASILEDSEARLILTGKENLQLAKKIRDKVNKAIPVITIPHDSLDETAVKEIETPFSPDQPAVYSYDFTGPGPDQAADISSQELREHLARELPDYMIPSYFVPLGKIPLTPNGKIDGKSLPHPGESLPQSNIIPPGNEVEIKLVQIWSEILNIENEKIGIENNFFELGGNSLNLITLVSKIYKELGIEVSITRIFDNPVIKEISNYIYSNKGIEEPVILLNQPSEKNLFAFPPGVGFGIAYSNLASLIRGYSFYSFNFIEDDDRLNRYADIITNLQPTGPYVLFGYSAAGGLIFQVARTLENKGYEVSDIILADSFWRESETDDSDQVQGFTEFVRLVESELEMWGLQFLKDKVKEKMKTYLEYVIKLTTLEVVNANVHVLRSEQSREENLDENPQDWAQFTTKAVVSYNAYGNHDAMFASQDLGKNANLLMQILNQISE